MRVSKRRIPIVNYMIACLTVMMAVLAVFMVAAVNFMANRAEEQAIREKLGQQIRTALWRLEYRDGQFYEKNNSKERKLDEDFEYVILDTEDRVVFGEYPQELEAVAAKISGRQHFQTIEAGDTVYYVLDKTNSMERILGTGREYTIRGMVDEANIKTVYQQFKLYAYMGVAGAAVLVVLMGFVLRRQISVPMKSMCGKAAQISENLDLSERMEYNGIFQELDVLIGAYNTLLERMEDVVERQEHFNSDVSHELRTPISVIRAQCQLTAGQIRQNRAFSMEKVIAVIDRQAGKMDGIVEQLLEMSRMDQGRRELSLERVELVDIVESVCEDEEDLGKHPFVYHLKPVTAEVDINLITLAIRNLVSNAGKYSEEGKTIEVYCGMEGDRACVRVKDFGCGIPEKERSRIFEYYYRAEKSRNSEGFGLGLTIARKIARLHGGDISVESEVGFGSTFTLSLPMEGKPKGLSGEKRTDVEVG